MMESKNYRILFSVDPVGQRARNKSVLRRFFTFSAAQLVALGLCTLIGLIVGSSFLWTDLDRAWTNLVAGFLWVLVISAASSIVRFVRERIRRGEWRRGIALGCEMTFPTTTMYMLAIGMASLGAAEMIRPDLLMVAPIFYSITLVLAVLVGPVYMLTSPFGTLQTRPRTAPVRDDQHDVPEHAGT